MRVSKTGNVPQGSQRLTPTEERPSAGAFQHNFQRQMSDAQSEAYQKYIDELTESIYQQGEKLTKKVDVAEFQKYRELITKLFHEAASNSYMFCKSDKFDNRGRHKVYSVIRKVNQRLDEMAAMVLKKESDNLDLLHAVDDIRGMLVDMLL